MTKFVDISFDLETWGKRPGCDIRSIGAAVMDFENFKTADPNNGGSGFNNCFYRACENPGWEEWENVPHEFRESPHEQWSNVTGLFHKYPLYRDRETVEWWSQQSNEAQAAFENRVDLKRSLIAFGEWLDRVTQDARPIINPSRVAGLVDPVTGETEWIDARAVGVIHDQRLPLHKWTGLRLWSHGAAFDPGILAEAYYACGLEPPWHYRAPRDTRTLFDDAGHEEDHSEFLQQFNTGVAHHALWDAVAQGKAICYAKRQLVFAWDARNGML